MLIKLSHPSHFLQTVKDHISGRLLPPISHGKPVPRLYFVPFRVRKWSGSETVRKGKCVTACLVLSGYVI